MKLFFKIAFFIFTMIISTAEEARSFAVGPILQKEVLAEALSPLTPIIISTSNNLQLVAMALDAEYPAKEDIYIVPAIFLKYKNDKELSDEILSNTLITLDVATIALSGGTALATKLHWAKRVWALIEVAGAAENIAVNLDVADDPSFRHTLNVYNATMGLIGLKNVGTSTARALRSFSDAVSDALKSNSSLRNLFFGNYENWLRSAANLERLTDDQIELLVRQNAIFEELVGSANTDALVRILRSDPELAHLVRDGSKVDFNVLRGAKGEGKLFKNIDEFKAAVSRGENVFYIGKHLDIIPRPTGVQSHHGVNTVWMDNNYVNYIERNAPSVYMLNNPNHNATRGVFNTWRAEISKLQGTNTIDYTKITKEDIIKLAER